MYAQSVVEYGAVSSRVSSSFRQFADSIEDWVTHQTPMTWLVIGAVVVVAFTLWRRL